MTERVQKILSQWGIASRRRAEQLILEGRVRLNGRIVNLGDKADPYGDRLEVDNKQIKPANRPQKIYLLLNKPLDVISTCEDPQKRTTVIDLLPKPLRQGQGIHPVGRLDRDSSGAIILTNDGDLTLSLTHPRYHLPKTYQVLIDGYPSEASLQKWREGVILMGKNTLPAQVTVLKRMREQTLLQVILTEGKNRQIRRIVKYLGFNVLGLHRTAIGSIKLDPTDEPELPIGKYRYLNPLELKFLANHVNHVLTEANPLYV